MSNPEVEDELDFDEDDVYQPEQAEDDNQQGYYSDQQQENQAVTRDEDHLRTEEQTASAPGKEDRTIADAPQASIKSAPPPPPPLQQQPKQHPRNLDTNMNPLPPGWVARTSRDGDIYYKNSSTGKSQWDIPQPDPPQEEESDGGTPPPLPLPHATISSGDANSQPTHDSETATAAGGIRGKRESSAARDDPSDSTSQAQAQASAKRAAVHPDRARLVPTSNPSSPAESGPSQARGIYRGGRQDSSVKNAYDAREAAMMQTSTNSTSTSAAPPPPSQSSSNQTQNRQPLPPQRDIVASTNRGSRSVPPGGPIGGGRRSAAKAQGANQIPVGPRSTTTSASSASITPVSAPNGPRFAPPSGPASTRPDPDRRPPPSGPRRSSGLSIPTGPSNSAPPPPNSSTSSSAASKPSSRPEDTRWAPREPPSKEATRWGASAGRAGGSNRIPVGPRGRSRSPPRPGEPGSKWGQPAPSQPRLGKDERPILTEKALDDSLDSYLAARNRDSNNEQPPSHHETPNSAPVPAPPAKAREERAPAPAPAENSKSQDSRSNAANAYASRDPPPHRASTTSSRKPSLSPPRAMSPLKKQQMRDDARRLGLPIPTFDRPPSRLSSNANQMPIGRPRSPTPPSRSSAPSATGSGVNGGGPPPPPSANNWGARAPQRSSQHDRDAPLHSAAPPLKRARSRSRSPPSRRAPLSPPRRRSPSSPPRRRSPSSPPRRRSPSLPPRRRSPSPPSRRRSLSPRRGGARDLSPPRGRNRGYPPPPSTIDSYRPGGPRERDRERDHHRRLEDVFAPIAGRGRFRDPDADRGPPSQTQRDIEAAREKERAERELSRLEEENQRKLMEDRKKEQERLRELESRREQERAAAERERDRERFAATSRDIRPVSPPRDSPLRPAEAMQRSDSRDAPPHLRRPPAASLPPRPETSAPTPPAPPPKAISLADRLALPPKPVDSMAPTDLKRSRSDMIDSEDVGDENDVSVSAISMDGQPSGKRARGGGRRRRRT